MMPAMELEQAIRTRRTHKVFQREPLPRALTDELLELARWAPNHRLTNPWRFRVLGPQSLERLVLAAEAHEPGSGSKLRRAPTVIIVSSLSADDPVLADENVQAVAAAAYIVLLAAHARGFAGYWRTPSVLRSAAGRATLGIHEGEVNLGLLNLGSPREERPAPEREPLETYATYLD